MIKPLDRRTFLRGASGVALALPFLDAMTPLSALAAVDPTRPRRIIFVFTANGDDPNARMTNTSETGFTFSSVRGAFTPYKSDMVVMEGIDKRHYLLPDGFRADGHEQGGSALGPWKSGSGSFPIGGAAGQYIGYIMGPTADVALGQRVLQDVPSMPRTHFFMRVGDQGNNIWNVHSHDGPVGTQAPGTPSTNPFDLYRTTFGNLTAAGPSPELLRRIAKQRSALDLVNGELGILKSKLGAADRARLDKHTDALRDVERSLVLPEVQNACQPFDPGTQVDPYASQNYAVLGQLFFKITALAFACDTTRVVNYNWSGNTNDRVYSNLPLTNTNTGHHSMSHINSASAFADIRTINTELHTQSTKLYDLLKNTEDGTGTLWDHTLIVHWNELDLGYEHSNGNNMVIFAGGAHNYFRRGRYLNLANTSANSFSDVLVSCFHYMGYEDVTTFGEPELATGGPVPGLT